MRSPFVTALLNPVNLAILALTAAAGLCSAWWLAPVGLLLWGFMVLAIATNPNLRFTQEVENRAPLAMRFDQLFKRIQRNQISLYNKLQSAKSGTRRSLQPLQDRVNALTEHTFQLCLRMSALENHRLVTQRSRNLNEEMALIDAKIISASDERVRQEFEESKAALYSQREKLDAISAGLDRFEAQLLSLASALEGIITEAVHLQVMKSMTVETDLNPLLEQLLKLDIQLGEFDHPGELRIIGEG
jgi:chromosome segregation ATPase